MLLFLAALVSFNSKGQNGQSKIGNSRLPAIVDSILQSQVDADKIPGAVIQIKKGEKFLYKKAYGYAQKYDYNHHLLQPAEKMTVDDLFDIASLTKVVGTTTSIMLLADRGLLKIDDPVGKYIPAFNSDEQSGTRHLLCTPQGSTR